MLTSLSIALFKIFDSPELLEEVEEDLEEVEIEEVVEEAEEVEEVVADMSGPFVSNLGDFMIFEKCSLGDVSSGSGRRLKRPGNDVISSQLQLAEPGQ